MINLRHLFRKPRRWFVSDLHIGHTNVISYCNRPFKTKEEMNEAIVKKWNRTVAKKDTVYILGDLSLNPKVAFEYLPRLNGKKILVAGNHDSCWIGHQKSTKMQKKYEAYCEFVYKHHSSVVLKDGTFVTLCHLPYKTEDGNKFDQRYSDYKLEDIGTYLCHGHLHGRYKKFGRMIDVGYDAHGGKILSEDDVIALINDPREFIESPLTKFYEERAKENLPAAD